MAAFWGISSSGGGAEHWAEQAACAAAVVADKLQERSLPAASVKTNTR